jgi:HAD superfamily hydrolase (TIGR01509 family)
MLEGIGLRDCFRVITAAEDVSKGKPDPEGYLSTLDELRARARGKPIRPEQSLIFEDAPRVIERAASGRLQDVGVPTHYGPDELKADFDDPLMKPADVGGVP